MFVRVVHSRKEQTVRLYVVRHAKAEDHSERLRDFDRELTPKGRAQAGALACLFAARTPPLEVPPEVIVTSPAPRASGTADIIAASLRLSAAHDSRLSTTGGQRSALEVVRELALSVGSAVIVGHNPTLEEVIEALGGNPSLSKAECVVMDVRASARSLRGSEIGRVRG